MAPANNPQPPDIGSLRAIGLFQALDSPDLTAVALAAQYRQVERGAAFFLQGDPATVCYVLTQGRVRLVQVTPEGQQVILRFIGAGEGFGVVAALSNTVYPAAAEAVDDCLALAWDGETLATLMERYPRLAINGMRLLAERVREFQDRLRELVTERVARRVARTLLRLVRQGGRKVEGGVLIDLPLSRQDLAEMTGTTLYTVSRILSQWEQQGFIETGRKRVLIRSPHGLVAIAEDLPPGSPPEPH
ncbi:MAG: Crp/Fnr family transcriptional regulator [Ardenticatenaceae bacterium]|nr:Crp/Fnr family transcriptional regulator [Ardenticatenaceae bacterium]